MLNDPLTEKRLIVYSAPAYMNRLLSRPVGRLYKACVDVTHNAYFGLSVAKFIHISNLHALGYALAASSSLMAFCQRLERFFRLASQACEIEISESGDEVSLRVKLLVTVCGETQDAMMGFVVLAMRQLTSLTSIPCA